MLLSCTGVYTPTIMKQAKDLVMVNDWAWIVAVCTNFSLDNTNLSVFTPGKLNSNITHIKFKLTLFILDSSKF